MSLSVLYKWKVHNVKIQIIYFVIKFRSLPVLLLISRCKPLYGSHLAVSVILNDRASFF